MAGYLKPQLLQFLKEGYKHFDEPVQKNIQACKDISKISRTSFGPYGLNKLIINHLGKLFCTHDAATIMKELEVEHPAAKLLCMASKAQEEEIGDGSNLVLILAGELLNQASQLVRQGLHTSDVIQGYAKALEHTLAIAPTLAIGTIENFTEAKDFIPALQTAIGSKQYDYAPHLARLVAEACVLVCPKNPKSFNVDNIRISKLEGGGVLDTQLVYGFVINRDTEGTVKHLTGAKIAVYNCAVDNAHLESKGTVDITTAEQLKNFSKSEERNMERIIGKIAAAGVKVVVSSQSFGDLAMHFIEKHGMMAVKVASKFELRRLTAAINATQIVTLDAPTPEEVGRCDEVKVEEIAGHKVTVFRQLNETSKLATLVVRGATANVMDDVERAIDDGVNTFKALTRDGRYVAGAGAFEIELARQLTKVAEETPGMDQYALRKFAQSFEIIPTTLAEVAGHNGINTVTALLADHQAGRTTYGIDLEDGSSKDLVSAGVVDAYATKHWAIQLAVDAALTVLRVDQIIMAKAAGGPKPRGEQARDED
eukprot:TRINITY_DN475_c0_g1_i2.p1 TRINITY_DN475_c0_g1~~TRINITY_DN475_c0_g1_i2.p1  ORF type:complete len:539 (-),score=168.09 TRINITY_DN475_c0_g1_i2:458-2074(-)